MNTLTLAACFGGLLTATIHAAVVVNADFSRDIVNGTNPPAANPAPVLYTGTGPAADPGTFWNNATIPLAATGDQGANTIAHPVQFNNLTASDGATPTPIDIQLTSGFFRSFNGTAAAANTAAALQNDRVFSNNNNIATLTIQGLNPEWTYDLFFINSGGFDTNYTIGSTTLLATGEAFDGAWTAGVEHASFAGIRPTASGEVAVAIQGSGQVNGAISGLQIVQIVPEPSAALLLVSSLLGLSLKRRRTA